MLVKVNNTHKTNLLLEFLRGIAGISNFLSKQLFDFSTLGFIISKFNFKKACYIVAPEFKHITKGKCFENIFFPDG